MLSPDLNVVRVGTHKRSCPDSKHWPVVTMLSPDLNVVRVQHLTLARMFNANPNEVRVRPHKRSAANLKRLTLFLDVTREPERSEGSRQNEGFEEKFALSHGKYKKITLPLLSK
jgi:hypothetical protein